MSAWVNQKLWNRVALQTWIELACDGDYRSLSDGSSLAARLTIAEALKVLGAE